MKKRQYQLGVIREIQLITEITKLVETGEPYPIFGVPQNTKS